MRRLAALLLILITTRGEAFFPTTPVLPLTPGALCSRPDSLRYPEQIAYCNRDVSPELKRAVMKLYVRHFPNLKINADNRLDFKIDHYIPLCMGGSNDITNLWPQHKSIFFLTDEIELNLCNDMADGIIKQKDAILQMKYAKNHPEQLRMSKDPMRFVKENYLKPDHPIGLSSTPTPP